MRTAPGTLLKRQRVSAGTLLPSPQSRKLVEHLHDLITIAYERSTNRRSNSLSLIRLEYVIGEKLDAKYSMHFVGLVRELEAPVSAPLRLTFTVERDDQNDW